MSGRSARRRGSKKAATAGALLCLLGVSDPAAAQEAVVPAQPTVEDLYHPGHGTRYAVVNRKTVAYDTPSTRARPVGRLGLLTEDGTTEIVVILARTVDRGGRMWLRVRLPVRPNGTDGWVPRDALGEIKRVRTWLRVDRASTTMTLVRAGRLVFRARIGVGRAVSPTPAGDFYIRNRLHGPQLGRIYGALAFGTSAHSDVLTDWPGGGVIGIHGTNQPGLLPGRVSHGCVRMRNADILRLAPLLPVGTPVTIT